MLMLCLLIKRMYWSLYKQWQLKQEMLSLGEYEMAHKFCLKRYILKVKKSLRLLAWFDAWNYSVSWSYF